MTRTHKPETHLLLELAAGVGGAQATLYRQHHTILETLATVGGDGVEVDTPWAEQQRSETMYYVSTGTTLTGKHAEVGQYVATLPCRFGGTTVGVVEVVSEKEFDSNSRHILSESADLLGMFLASRAAQSHNLTE